MEMFNLKFYNCLEITIFSNMEMSFSTDHTAVKKKDFCVAGPNAGL